jgi:VanZ family protein
VTRVRASSWSKRVLFWGLVLAHMALIFAASSSPDPGLPTDVSDKTAHFAAYGLLGALLFNALADGALSGMTWTRGLLAVVLAVAYGLTDELHQRVVPQRTPDPLDVAADAAGACAAVLALLALRHVRSRLASSRASR